MTKQAGLTFTLLCLTLLCSTLALRTSGRLRLFRSAHAAPREPDPEPVAATPVIGATGDDASSKRWRRWAKDRIQNVAHDDAVVLFPTFAHRDHEDPTEWQIHVRGWIYRSRTESLKRRAAVFALAKAMRVPRSAVEKIRFSERMRSFMMRNRRDRQIEVLVCPEDSEDECGVVDIMTTLSDKFGHVQARSRLDESDLPRAVRQTALGSTDPPVSLNMRAALSRRSAKSTGSDCSALGLVFFVPPVGWSIISDIDDTVKITEVGQYEAMVNNTFCQEFRVVPCMDAVYQSWQQQGAAFHYVSSCPWQLQPELQAFFERVGLPLGSFHLKDFDIRNRKLLNVFVPSTTLKPLHISSIMASFPQRRFVLVGDSGEKDPEIYAEMFRKFPDQIGHVLIRIVPHGARDEAAMAEVFAGVPRDRWTAFRDARQLLNDADCRDLSKLAPLRQGARV